ncbi:hypothetical protein WMF18_41280 [Sorangium sp. So ce315]|uniref:hypothetical protein n=1 Tax=Sorangium sp. So ce315 TaxID=3133299 RepID=UPI003F61AF86
MAQTAAVTITLQKVLGVDGLLAGAKRPYALGFIAGRRFGRSKPIPAGAKELDLTAEAIPWKLEVAASGAIPVAVEIWDDQGDAGSKRLGSVTGSLSSPYPTRVHELGGGPLLRCDVFTREVPPAPGAVPVPRVAEGEKTRATLRVPNTVLVSITEILGLHAPVSPGAAGVKRAEARPGYTSQDHLGRVYVNSDLAGAWAKDKQLIQLTAKVKVQRGKLPADAKIRWTVIEPDDPTNDDPGFHAAWGAYVDKKDYDAAGKHQGSRAGDNEGKPAKSPPWEAVSGFALASAAATEAKTTIVGDESKVVFHCPDTAGDNFIVRADIDSATKVEGFGAETGIMTMWHRIRVESIRMKSAFALPMDEVPVPFEPCCVQLDCEPEKEVPDQPQMAPKGDDLETECVAYVDKVFSNKSNPGWFCVISAMEPHPLPTKKGDQVFEGDAELKSGGAGANLFEYFEIPGTFPDVDFAELTSGSETVGFNLFSVQTETTGAGPITRCWIVEHDAQPDFTAGDGSIAHAYKVQFNYSPRYRKKGGAVTPGGYGMAAKVKVKVFNPGAFYTAGISPTVTAKGKEYFAGRTIMFTHHSAYREAATGLPKPTYRARIVGTIVHELVHAFGMPHKCGYFDFRAPRDKTCCMNYRPNWMLDDKRNLIPGTSGKTGSDVCGRHLKEVRRVHLEDNKGLAWK